MAGVLCTFMWGLGRSENSRTLAFVIAIYTDLFHTFLAFSSAGILVSYSVEVENLAGGHEVVLVSGICGVVGIASVCSPTSFGGINLSIFE